MKQILRDGAARLVKTRFDNPGTGGNCYKPMPKNQSDLASGLPELGKLAHLARSRSPRYDFNRHLALLQAVVRQTRK